MKVHGVRWSRIAGLALGVSGCNAIAGINAGTPRAEGEGGSSTGSGVTTPVCTADEVRPCYTGAAGTQGQSLCRGGQQTCNLDGSGFGDCVGEITPTAEDNCEKNIDTTCDGKLVCPCTPGTMMPCYDGPSGTEGQGICKPGIRTCQPGGMSYGACAGQVTPKLEDCLSPVDEDCDGTPITCVGGSIIAGAPGTATGDDSVFAVASDAMGNIFLGGVSSSSGGSSYPLTTGSADVTKLDKSGAQIWEKSFPGTGSAGYSVVRGVTVDGMGDVIVIGEYRGAISSNGVSLTSASNTIDVFVIKLDTTGATIWSKTFGGTGDQLGTSISAGASGDVFITGMMDGVMSFGAGTLTSNGNYDVFLARLDSATGDPKWIKNFGDASQQIGRNVVATPDGNVAVTGQCAGNIGFGGNNLAGGGGADIFLAKLDGNDGSYVWAKRFGDGGEQIGFGIAADSDGNIVITGAVQGKTDFGGGPLDVGVGNPNDLFVACFTANGAHTWSTAFGDLVNSQIGRAVAVDPAGNVLVTGYFNGVMQFGTTTLTNPAVNGSTPDVFVAKLKASDGTPGWARTFGYMSDQLARAITTDSFANVIIGGTFKGTIDFAPPAALSFASLNNTYDAFWVKLAP